MSSEKLKHITSDTEEIIKLSDEERIKWIHGQRWIGYPLAKVIMEKLDWLIKLPPTDRMPNLIIYGNTNNGKTSLVRQFTAKNGSFKNEDSGIVEYPVLYMQMPPSPEESRFYDSILDILKAPYRQRDSISRKQRQASTMMKNLGVRLLIIDEFHHMLFGHLNKQRLLLSSLKYFANELKIPIVVVGTEDALRAIRVIDQISNRFDQLELSKWQLNDNFRRLCSSFERILPLRSPSDLHTREVANRLYSMSEGNIGELSQILNLASTQAINDGSESITLDLLNEINWIQPIARLGEIE